MGIGAVGGGNGPVGGAVDGEGPPTGEGEVGEGEGGSGEGWEGKERDN